MHAKLPAIPLPIVTHSELQGWALHAVARGGGEWNGRHHWWYQLLGAQQTLPHPVGEGSVPRGGLEAGETTKNGGRKGWGHGGK